VFSQNGQGIQWVWPTVGTLAIALPSRVQLSAAAEPPAVRDAMQPIALEQDGTDTAATRSHVRLVARTTSLVTCRKGRNETGEGEKRKRRKGENKIVLSSPFLFFPFSRSPVQERPRRAFTQPSK
jgi:hypothetical protein